jgi:dTDP-4-amino-4,6-dideoxygalactose transaminase
VIALRAFGRYRNKKVVRSSDLTCQQVSSNYRLSEFQSAVLLAQLEKFTTQDKQRLENASFLTAAIEEMPGLEHVCIKTKDLKHGYYYYLIRYTPEAFGNLNPDRMCQVLNAEGIPFVAGDRMPLYAHPVFEAANLDGYLNPTAFERYRRMSASNDAVCPEVEKACRCTLILRHEILLGGRKDMDDIVAALWKIIDNIRELS